MDSFASFESLLLIEESPLPPPKDTSSIPTDQEYCNGTAFSRCCSGALETYMPATFHICVSLVWAHYHLSSLKCRVRVAGISGSDYRVPTPNYFNHVSVETMKGIFLRQRSPLSQESKGIKEGYANVMGHVSDATLQKVTRPDYKISSQSQEESSPDTQSEDDPESDTDIGTAVSEVAETISARRTFFSQRPSPDVREKNVEHRMKAWYEFDLAITVALVSPVGNWLTGGDHVKNVMLLLLLVFYLHQIIEGHGADHTLRAKMHPPKTGTPASLLLNCVLSSYFTLR
ncbi:hypothetical protein M404DRAFT_10493 [Pisolithus tinctorius Marx 270]|uniref:Uncharacterized protein n=1 Tax=Pisolithus tinctorius Marx 270 TaxID=870435 RepID=A0A0C3JMW3_PISTI|nr:hypothetical protein M404DRAFT_10493 [Pisolithus tinctorius Marx 270]